MNCLYRYRKYANWSISDLSKNKIAFSKFSKMKDDKEVPVSYDYSKIKNKQFTKENIDLFLKTIRDHIIQDYYLACFTTERPTPESKMWEEYSNGCGFCIVYSKQKINNTVQSLNVISVKQKSENIFKINDVYYDHSDHDITPFFNAYLNRINKDSTKKDIEYISKNIHKLINKEEKKVLMDCFFHKTGKYVEKQETRIVSNFKRKTPHTSLIKLKPEGIILGPCLNDEQKTRLRAIMRKIKIKEIIV